MPTLTPLFSGKLPLRIAALMSGSGTNLCKILKKRTHSYEVVVVFTDNPQSNASKISRKYGIPYEENDISVFYNKYSKPKKDLSLRPVFDEITINKLKKYKPDILAYCGYMSIASPVLVNAFLGVNVHPADLSILQENGKRKYIGGNAVRDAILAGEKTIRSTTHLVEEEVDGGRILMRARPVSVHIPKDFDPENKELVERITKEHQERLKREGDWVIFPLTLQYIAEKRFTQDKGNGIHFDGQPCPKGITL